MTPKLLLWSPREKKSELQMRIIEELLQLATINQKLWIVSCGAIGKLLAVYPSKLLVLLLRLPHRLYGSRAQHSIMCEEWHNVSFQAPGYFYVPQSWPTALLCVFPLCGWGRKNHREVFLQYSSYREPVQKKLSSYFKVASFHIVLFSIILNNAVFFPFFAFPFIQSSFASSFSIA